MPITNRPIQILLIEDNREHAELLGRLLGFSEHPRFTITVAVSLADGIAKLSGGAYDIVLLDLSLPDSKGAETFHRINAVSGTVPVVILSGVSDVTSAIEIVHAGAQDYLVKGHVDMHLLLRSIQYAIERKRGQVAGQQLNADLEARVKERTSALETVNEQLQHEIAERRQAEEQLVKSNQQLTVTVAELRSVQRSRASDRTASATREIEDAFKRIQQLSEVILRAPGVMTNAEKTSEHLQQILSAAEAGRKALRKPGNGPEIPAAHTGPVPDETFETVALDTLIDHVSTLCSANAGEQAGGSASKITFVRKTGSGAEIQGDPIRLREMLTHLVRNSMNAIPRRGTITVGAQQQGDEVILTVQDDGLGVTEAVRQRLLEPSAATARAGGLPSGYGVIHEVVARHRGRLEIESRKGIGTMVSVIFPSAKSTGAPPPKLRVLVVDDDAIVREVISTYLTEDGCTVTVAVDGRDGLEKFCAGEFDIVLTDRTMPGMQGDELAREVKKRCPDVAVILITGFGDAMLAAGEKPEGVDIVMSKPFTMAGLQGMLSKFH